LPLIALPVLIHLINRQRHRSIEWAAMMFLRDARRLTRGMAKIRQILILTMRTLAVAALIFAVSRPLASGWLGLAAGGSPDTTIVLLDRSASMEQQGMDVGRTKRFAALEKVSELIKRSSPNTRIVIIDSAMGDPRVLTSADSLRDLPITSSTATTADIPLMMLKALDYITTNETGRTDVWLCSDLRSNDWDTDGGRWPELRESYQALDGIRFHLLTYADTATENLSVHVTGTHRRQVGEQAEVVMDVRLQRESESTQSLKVPLEFVVNGTRSKFDVTMTDKEYVLQGHSIPLDSQIKDGWGHVELPQDSNVQDNVSHFVFAEPPSPQAIVVSDNADVAGILQLAAETPPNPTIKHQVTVLPTSRTSEINWAAFGLLLWHGPLPKGITAQQVENFIAAGKTAIFFPPDRPDDTKVGGVNWDKWQASPDNQKGVRIDRWRTQSELLAQARDGTALPVGQLRTFRYCTLSGPLTPLASFEKGGSFLSMNRTDHGRVYFCSTLPATSHSSLAQEGVVLYVMIQRALAYGSASLGRAQHQTANTSLLAKSTEWQPLDPLSRTVLPSQRSLQAGVYRSGGKLLAIRSSQDETTAKVMSNEKLAELFGALDYVQVTDQVGNKTALASEAWRLFLYAVLIALLAEAFLCVPQKRKPSEETSNFTQTRDQTGAEPVAESTHTTESVAV